MRQAIVPLVLRSFVSKIVSATVSPASPPPLGPGAGRLPALSPMGRRPALNRSHAAGPGALRQAVRPGGQPRGAGPGRWAGVLLCASVLLLLGWPVPGSAQTTTCTSTSTAVTGFTGAGTGLVTDCTTLLGLEDELRGTATLNWAETLAMSSWDGITVAGTSPRVTALILRSKSLTGTLPEELGNLTGLTNLDLQVNQLTGSIPTELGLLN